MSIVTRIFLITALMAGLGVRSYGDEEATQCKAFIEFLQTRIIDNPGIHVPALTEEQMKSFGGYTQDYGILLRFNDGRDKNVSPRAQQVFHNMMRFPSELATRRDNLADATEGMRSLRTTLDTELTSAGSAHAALKQSDELKSVYDKAYDKTVTVRAKTFKEVVFLAFENEIQGLQDFASYLDRHPDAIKIDGTSIRAIDPKLDRELTGLIDAMLSNAQAIQDAGRKFQAMMQGP